MIKNIHALPSLDIKWLTPYIAILSEMISSKTSSVNYLLLTSLLVGTFGIYSSHTDPLLQDLVDSFCCQNIQRCPSVDAGNGGKIPAKITRHQDKRSGKPWYIKIYV